jgi:hypothetical protein
VRFFRPLLQPLRDQLHLQLFKIVADAAFDAGYVYQDTRDQGGTPYIALNTRGHAVLQHRFGPHGRLLCADGREMDHAGQWFDRQKGYRRQRFACPFYNSQGQRKQALLGQTCHCQHPQFATGGCRHTINLDDPDQVRFTVDRGSRDFKDTYARRTDAERLFALAADYNLEHPEVESLPSVANLNTLIYLLLNVRVLEAAADAGVLRRPKPDRCPPVRFPRRAPADAGTLSAPPRKRPSTPFLPLLAALVQSFFKPLGAFPTPSLRPPAGPSSGACHRPGRGSTPHHSGMERALHDPCQVRYFATNALG